MSAANIIGTASGLNNFKIGEQFMLGGWLTRWNMGIAIKIGQMPYIIPLEAQVYDKIRFAYSKLAYDEEIAPAVSTSVLYNLHW